MWARALDLEAPLEKEVAPPPVLLPGKPHGQRSLEGSSPRGHWESDRPEHSAQPLREPASWEVEELESGWVGEDAEDVLGPGWDLPGDRERPRLVAQLLSQGPRVRMTRQLWAEGWGRPCTGHVPPSGLFSLSTQCVCPSPGGGGPAQVPQRAAKRHRRLLAAKRHEGALAGREEARSRWTVCRDRFPWSFLQGAG